MSKRVEIKLGSTVYNLSVDMYPPECGLCHKHIEPIFIGGVFVRGDELRDEMESAFQCTNPQCNSLIIGSYKKEGSTYKLIKSAPIIPKEKEFSPEILEVSPNFVKIYNQSLYAEQIGLTLISGIGYRKALEFLIKDYLVYLGNEEEEVILKLPLGQCINKLENHNIKEIAKRATWIGNDEAHYTRKWEDKDVSDLKKLIEVTVYFIAMDIAAKKYLKEMS
jgi:hypothetical protein